MQSPDSSSSVSVSAQMDQIMASSSREVNEAPSVE